MTLLEFADILENTDKEQCFKAMFQGEKCCALGLARLHICGPIEGRDIYKRNEEFITLIKTFFYVCNINVVTVNDVYRWDFKQIAQLIRSKHGT